MSAFLDSPAPFGAAQRWLREKVTLPTRLGSIDIANYTPASIRMRSFLSARMASVSVLEAMRSEVEKMVAGETTEGYARERLMAVLREAGMPVPDAGGTGDGDVRQFGAARLNLILRMNTSMAQAIGARAVSEHPDVVGEFPNYRYHANTDRHRAFDGLVLPKQDPFWQTHYPPWEFNCQCMVTDEQAGAENARSATMQTNEDGSQTGAIETDDGRNIPVAPNPSGFVFASGSQDAQVERDIERITEPGLREAFREGWQRKRQSLEGS